jgi:hypothetical protein
MESRKIRLFLCIITILTCGFGALIWIPWEIINWLVKDRPTDNFTLPTSVVPLPPPDPTNSIGPSNDDADDAFDLAWNKQH